LNKNKVNNSLNDVNFKIRGLRTSDHKSLWDWRNNIQTRLNSINVEEVSWSTHEEWVAKFYNSIENKLYIGELVGGDELIGMVRFEPFSEKEVSQVAINLNPKYRGLGFGEKLLKKGVKKFSLRSPNALLALIKSTNLPSIRCFERSGFALKYQTGDLLYYFKE
tara:strand:+ start:3760 stop:4251 length:492 start_codon:yes stop_codon:yes gene_type:complete